MAMHLMRWTRQNVFFELNEEGWFRCNFPLSY